MGLVVEVGIPFRLVGEAETPYLIVGPGSGRRKGRRP